MPLLPGDVAPDFTLLDHEGRSFRLEDALREQVVVLFFYAKDETFGCTREACHFRDHHAEFQAAGARVIGISTDSAASHQRFIHNQGLTYTLLSDPDGEVARSYGAEKALLGLLRARVTYVIDQRGFIRFVFDSITDFAGHVERSLGEVRRIAGAKQP